MARIVASVLRRRMPGRSVPQVRLRPGNARVLADLRTPLGLALYRYGYCELAAHVVRALTRPGSVFVDGGANVGLLTLIAAEQVGASGRVIACEPSGQTMAMLRRNVDINQFTWIEAHEVALAERPGKSPFYEFEAGAGFSSFAPEAPHEAMSRTVEVTTLDALLGDELSRVSLVKLDLEGAETKALRGAGVLLDAGRPDLLIEVENAHLQRQASSVSELQSLASEARYDGYSVTWEGRRLLASRLSAGWDDSPRSRDLLLRPVERRVESLLVCERT